MAYLETAVCDIRGELKEVIDEKFGLAMKVIKRHKWAHKTTSTRKSKRYGTWR